jgi:hypothetical protein
MRKVRIQFGYAGFNEIRPFSEPQQAIVLGLRRETELCKIGHFKCQSVVFGCLFSQFHFRPVTETA